MECRNYNNHAVPSLSHYAITPPRGTADGTSINAFHLMLKNVTAFNDGYDFASISCQIEGKILVEAGKQFRLNRAKIYGNQDTNSSFASVGFDYRLLHNGAEVGISSSATRSYSNGSSAFDVTTDLESSSEFTTCLNYDQYYTLSSNITLFAQRGGYIRVRRAAVQAEERGIEWGWNWRTCGGNPNPNPSPNPNPEPGNERPVVTSVQGTYMLVSEHSNKCANLEIGELGAGMHNGVSVIQYECPPTNSEWTNNYWKFEHKGNGEYFLRSEYSNKCISTIPGESWNGADILQSTCSTNAEDTLWSLEPIGNSYRIRQISTDKCLSLDTANGGMENLENIQLWECDDPLAASQVWTLKAAY